MIVEVARRSPPQQQPLFPASGLDRLGLERLRTKCRAVSEAQPVSHQLEHARSFVHHALAAWWRKVKVNARLRPVSLPLKPLPDDSLILAERVADEVAGLSLDEAAFVLGRTYSTMLPAEYRSANGVFYTPPSVAERLLDNAQVAGIDWSRHSALDPACGGGAFVGPIARRMLRSMGKVEPRIAVRNLAARLRGFELDAFSAWVTSCIADATIVEELGELPKGVAEFVEVGNTLSRPLDGLTYDLVVGNPPYGRLTLDSHLRSKFKRSLFGHANLYGVFLDFATHVARAGSGVVAFVTPTGFLCGEYFKKLRSLLAREAPPLLLDFVVEREGVFDDVLQETLLAVFRKGSKGSARISFVNVESNGAVAATEGGAFELPSPADEPWILPRGTENKALARRLRSMPTRMADWGYRVSTGPLVWNRFKERLREAKVKGAVPLLWAESVSPDGQFEFRAARRNHSPFFVAHADEEHLLVRRSCVLLQRTTAKEQRRRLIAAVLPSAFLEEHGAVTVENHLNMILPMVEKPAVSLGALAAFLNSDAADRAFRCISGTVAVSAYELEALPLPAVRAMAFVEKGVSRGAAAATVRAACDSLYDAQ